MTSIQWGILDPNAFQRGYENAKKPFDEFAEAQKKNALDNALRQYATNPNDPNAVNALAQVDPRLAIQVRQQQQTAQAQGAEQFQSTIKTAAEMIRNLKGQNPQMPDEQVYATVRQTLIANRAPGADQSPAQFDPQYYQGLLAMAAPKGQETTSLQKNYEFFQRTKPELADTYLQNQANPPRFISDGMGGGSFVATPGPTTPAASAGGGPEPGQVEDGYRFKGGDPARPENWEPVTGGPTPQASGNFRP